MSQGVHHILSEARGVYTPRDFVSDDGVTLYRRTAARWGIKPDDAAILAAGPDTEHYWETWGDVLLYARCEVDGFVFMLYWSGDLFAVCPELMTAEEKAHFGFDD